MSNRSKQNAARPSWQLMLLLFSLASMVGCVEEIKVFSGLKPQHPPALSPGCATLTSLQPTFRWEAFPEREATESHPKISAVTYELKIWLAAHGAPSDLVYAREGLGEPAHTIQESLQAGKTYFWSPRARFLLNGSPRVTDWGQQLLVSIRLPDHKPGEWLGNAVIDHQYYGFYCFHTPKDSR